MSPAYKRVGSVAARLSMDDCNVKLADSAATATLVYSGDLALLKAKAADFTVGGTSSAIPSNLNISGDPFKVTSVEINGGPGGTGRLTVGLSATSHTTSGDNPTEKNVDWQIEWTLVERPLEQHPTFAPLFTASGTLRPINAWKEIPPKYIDYKFQFKVPNNLENPTAWASLTGDALKFCQKLAKGITAYQVQVPVVRKTEYAPTASGASASSCGHREAPPKFANLANAWLKTADSWSKTGTSRWEHRQEWTGFDSLDTDLYPSS